MVTLAIVHATGFSQLAAEEFTFYIVQRSYRDLILLEEKNTDKNYRIEYDNQYRYVSDVIKEIVEELRTRQLDIRLESHEDEPVNWDYYTQIVQQIGDLIEHGVETLELQGKSVAPAAQLSPPVVISLEPVIEAEFRFIKDKYRHPENHNP